MWRLESEQGRWHTASFQFQVDLKRPNLGWSDIRLSEATPEGAAVRSLEDVPFQVLLPGSREVESLSDCYVRQADLIATYTQRSDRTVRPQLLWRVLQDEARVGVETLVSMQTSLLDSAPKATVAHQLGGELWRVEAQSQHPCVEEQRTQPVLLLQRPPGHDVSFVIAVHPADFHSATIAALDGGWRVEFKLFYESLEKGVIRRARLRGIYVPRVDDFDWARKCLAEMVSAAPPLTT